MVGSFCIFFCVLIQNADSQHWGGKFLLPCFMSRIWLSYSLTSISPCQVSSINLQYHIELKQTLISRMMAQATLRLWCDIGVSINQSSKILTKTLPRLLA